MINLNNKEDMLKSGIYAIINLANGKRYIGSTINFKKRLKRHNKDFRRKKHPNIYLQRAYDTLESNFQFEILEICDENELEEKEQKYLDEIFSLENHYDYYYNVARDAKSPMRRRKLTAEQKEAMSKRMIEWHKNNKNPLLGTRLSNETKEKISLSCKGLHAGEKNPFFNKKHSDEFKKWQGERNAGNKNPRYVSDIAAENILTGEKIISDSCIKLGKILGVSHSTILSRVDKNHKDFTEKLLKNEWKLYRILNEKE